MSGAAGSGLMVSKGIGEGTVSETKEEVAVVIFLVSCEAVPWPDVERKLVLTVNEMVEGYVVPGIGSAAVPSEVRLLSRGVKRNDEATGAMSSSTSLRDCSSTKYGVA